MKPILSLFVLILILSSCTSRTTQQETANITQAVLMNTFPTESSKKIQISVLGGLSVSDVKNQKYFERYKIQLTDSFNKIVITTDVDSDLKFKIDTDIDEGKYTVSLLNSKTSKVIQSKNMIANKQNDRVIINFNLD